MLNNGGEGSAATTAATPTTPRGVSLRAVRQVVTIPEKKEEKLWLEKQLENASNKLNQNKNNK